MSRGRTRDALLLARLIEDYLFEVEQTLAEDTRRAYEGPLTLYLRYLRMSLGREPTLRDVSIESARGWVAQLRHQPKGLRGGRAQGESPVAPATVRTYVGTVCIFANWLARPPQRYCDASPLQYFKMPKAEEIGKNPLTADEFARLLAAVEEGTLCAARSQALLYVLFDCGLRAKEIAQLTIGDVSLRDGVLLVRRAKGKKPRVVAVGRQTNLTLRRYAVARDSQPQANTSASAPFFQTIHGGQFTYFGLRSWMRRMEARAGQPHVYLHLLRHTSAIETLEAGADLRTVQLKLGHADIRTTQRYLNLAARDIGERQRAFSPADRLSESSTEAPGRISRSHGARPVRRDADVRLWKRRREEEER
ncbi:MAG TPA: tyrosine-type recombinase/integrase [Ktedonobacterales bacterium]|jgi:site-specific recombinase XerD